MANELERLTAALADRYAIQRELGRGGMATVYLAEDRKHERHVALKVLKPELSAILGAERFLAEIKVTANLQHPNILPLYDSGEADTFLYYVMPFVEGETLRDKLAREKQLSVEETIDIAKAVAGALSHAHSRGVIHRDIKPENILLESGQAVVADFGIALAVSTAGGNRLTESGLSLGTPQYMSPEQATGDRDLDARSDVYAMGAVVYELLTGDPPHTGSTVQAVIAKVLSERPTPIGRTRDLVPPNVEAAVQRALAKTPADRFPTAAQFAEALANPAFGATAAPVDPPARPPLGPPARRPAVLALGTVALLATVLAAWGWLRPHPVPTAPVARFTVTLPEDARLAGAGGSTIAMSPDGARLVYVGRNVQGQGQLYLRGLDQLSPSPIPGTGGGTQPFFSPDGLWLGFWAEGKVQKVAMSGGPPLTVFPADGGIAGASWGEAGVIVFASGGTRDLRQVPAGGGLPTVVATVDTTDAGFRWPEFLPDGKTALFTIRGQDGTDRLAAVNVTNGHLTRFEEPGSNPHYVASGHVVLANMDGSLMVVPFDAARVAVTGAAVPLAEGVSVGAIGAAKLGVARSGALAYSAGLGGGVGSVILVDRQGVTRSLTTELREYQSPRLSPDGTRLAVAITQSGSSGSARDIWVYDLAQRTLTRLSLDDAIAYRPAWTPDGRRISYTGARLSGPGGEIKWVAADGSAPAESLPGSPAGGFGHGWAPDGRTFLYERSNDLFVLRIDSATSHPFLETSARESAPSVSPDGHWLAYTSDESSRTEVYVRSFPTPSGKWQVSLAGGTEPRWSRDGRELFYRNGDRMMAAAVRTQPTFSVGERTELFSGTFQSNGDYAQYDVMRDGQGFIMLQGSEGSNDLIVVLHWFDQLANGGK